MNKTVVHRKYRYNGNKYEKIRSVKNHCSVNGNCKNKKNRNIVQISISVIALLLSCLTLNYNSNLQTLQSKLNELNRFYESAVSFPEDIENYSILFTSNYFNTKSENFEAEFKASNNIIKKKTIIEHQLNKNNKAYYSYNQQFIKYIEKEKDILDFINVSYRYLVLFQMNQDKAGFSYNNELEIEELEKERQRLHSKFDRLSLDIKEYYSSLSMYYSEEKDMLYKKYNNPFRIFLQEYFEK